jgi:hypothetical protein
MKYGDFGGLIVREDGLKVFLPPGDFVDELGRFTPGFALQ